MMLNRWFPPAELQIVNSLWGEREGLTERELLGLTAWWVRASRFDRAMRQLKTKGYIRMHSRPPAVDASLAHVLDWRARRGWSITEGARQSISLSLDGRELARCPSLVVNQVFRCECGGDYTRNGDGRLEGTCAAMQAVMTRQPLAEADTSRCDYDAIWAAIHLAASRNGRRVEWIDVNAQTAVYAGAMIGGTFKTRKAEQ